MNCKIVFNINGEKETLEFEVDSTPETLISSEELLLALKNNPEKFKELTDLLQDKQYNTINYKKVTLNTLLKDKGITSNCSLEYLRLNFPMISFPEGIEANILLLDNLTIGGRNIHGRIINSLGNEIFVVKGTDEDVGKLANFLRVKLSIEEATLTFDTESNDYKKLNELTGIKGKSSIEELLLDFEYNLSEYGSLTFKDGSPAFPFLVNTIRTILKFSTLSNYDDEFVLMINFKKRFYKKQYRVKTSDIIGDLLLFKPNILDFRNASSEDVVRFFVDEEYAKSKMHEYYPDLLITNPYEALFNILFLEEPDFGLTYKQHSSEYVYFKSVPRTVHDKYGIGYDTISTFDIIELNHRGYLIYARQKDGKTVYYISRGTLVEDSLSKEYSSEDDARKGIDQSVDKLDIKKNSFIEFKYRNKAKGEDGAIIWDNELEDFNITSKTNFPEGTIIRSIDIPVDKNTPILLTEQNLLNNPRQNYLSFYKFVDTWGFNEYTRMRITELINTPEKIELFLYKINEIMGDNRLDNALVQQILDMFTTQRLKYKEYYIESKDYKYLRNEYRYHVIPTNSMDILEYRKNNRIPVIRLMESISKVMNDKIGVPVNLLTALEVLQQFPEVNAATSKAFIRDGKIYINTSIASSDDLLHEYTHLILGVLKSNPELRRNYELLMYIVSKTNDGRQMIKKLNTIYTNASKIDIMEEAFCNLFSGYVMKTISPDSTEIFSEYKKNLKKGTDSIFGKLISDVSTLFGTSISSVFNRFNNDVANLLNQGGLNFDSTKQSRIFSNYISKLILDGKITEKCNG